MKKFIAKKKKPQSTKNWILHHTSYVNPHTCEACYRVPLLISLHNLVLCFYEQASCCGTSFQVSSFCIRDFLLQSSIFKQVCDKLLDQTFCEVCEQQEMWGWTWCGVFRVQVFGVEQIGLQRFSFWSFEVRKGHPFNVIHSFQQISKFFQVRFSFFIKEMVFISTKLGEEKEMFYDCCAKDLIFCQCFILSLWSNCVFLFTIFVKSCKP